MQRAVFPSALVLLGALLIGGGCLSSWRDFRSPGVEDAQEVVERYGDELRWGRLPEAAVLVHPDMRPYFQQLMVGQEDRLRITEFQVDSVELATNRMSGTAVVRYRLYRLPAVVEESRRESIHLRRGLSGAWYVEPDLRALANDLGVDPDSLAP
jgi:hypothetical protein